MQELRRLLATLVDKMMSPYSTFPDNTVANLAAYRDNALSDDQRREVQEFITEHRLLRRKPPVKNARRIELYQTLLHLAFESPLDYLGYCQLEESLGIAPGKQMQRPLAEAIDVREIRDPAVAILVLSNVGTNSLERSINEQNNIAELLSSATDPQLYAAHAQVVYQAALHYLERHASRLDEHMLRTELNRHSYLAPTLLRLGPGKFDYQFNELRKVLRLAYRDGLDEPAIRHILGDGSVAPTIALFAAILTMVPPEDASRIDRELARRLTRAS
jgi:hypothetical protein